MHILLIGGIFFTEHEFYQELKKYNFSIDRVRFDAQILTAVRLYDYDLVLIEIDNFDESFFSIIEDIRTVDNKIPIILVSKRDNVETKVKAFQAGIDDYVTIPFYTNELIARCNAILRRVDKMMPIRVLTLGNLVINLETHEVEVDHVPLHLTEKEYLILELMALRSGVLISKSVLVNNLYGEGVEPDVKIIDVFVCKLRKKLAIAGVPEDLISTIWGQGYILRKPMSSDI